MEHYRIDAKVIRIREFLTRIFFKEEMHLNIEAIVEDVRVKLLQLAVIKLPNDVKEALQRAHREEETEAGKTQLEAILKNID